ncbi:MAG: hypothetical protein ACR2PE_05200 [Porticoccus sp.]
MDTPTVIKHKTSTAWLNAATHSILPTAEFLTGADDRAESEMKGFYFDDIDHIQWSHGFQSKGNRKKSIQFLEVLLKQGVNSDVHQCSISVRVDDQFMILALVIQAIAKVSLRLEGNRGRNLSRFLRMFKLHVENGNPVLTDDFKRDWSQILMDLGKYPAQKVDVSDSKPAEGKRKIHSGSCSNCGYRMAVLGSYLMRAIPSCPECAGKGILMNLGFRTFN